MKFNLLFLFICFSISTCFAQNEVRKDSITALFSYNQSEILNTENLLQVFDKIDASSLTVIKVIGYTDSTGSLKRNKVLAAERIRSVESLLKSSGLNRVKVETVNANELSGSRAIPDELNRRVDLLIYGTNSVSKPKLAFELNKPLNLNINFVGGKAEFLTTSYPNLEKLKNLMLEDSTLHLKLHGHVCCDNDMPLSIKRAEAVMQYLIQNEINANRMTAEGFSNFKLLAPDNSEANMSLNRRVEAIFFRKP
ncbi:MAG: OmpA family protein [Fluviicola sp.]